MDKTAVEQLTEDTFNLVKKSMKEPLSESELKTLAEKFHSTPEFIKLDGELIRGMGFTEELCGTAEDAEAYEIKEILKTTNNLNIQYIKERLTSFKYLIPWIVMFRGRTYLPIDVFAEGLSYLSQIKGRNQDNFNKVNKLLLDYAGQGQVSFDISKPEDLGIIKKCMDEVLKEAQTETEERKEDKDKDKVASSTDQVDTVVAVKGAKIAITVDGFSIISLRSQLNELKA